MILLKGGINVFNKKEMSRNVESSSIFLTEDINWPKITIITPSYNQGKYIEETIQSVINQDYPNLEYIIIDGGSTDESVDIIKKYEKHLHYWVSEPDNGQAHAINKGLKKAKGEVFNWLNSDDYLEPGSLLEIGKHFRDNPETHVLCGYTHCYFQDAGKTSHTYQMGVRKTVAKTILNVEMNQPGSYYRLSIVKDLGGVNESLRYVFDDELWFKYLCKYGLKKIAFVNQLIAHFRLHDNSKSVGEGFSEFWKELTNIYYEMAKQLKLPDFLINAIKKDTLLFKYQSINWNFFALEPDEFEAWFCNKYQYLYYKDFKYDEAINCFKKASKHKLLKFEKKTIMLWIKLFMINRKLLNLIRNKKQYELEA